MLGLVILIAGLLRHIQGAMANRASIYDGSSCVRLGRFQPSIAKSWDIQINDVRPWIEGRQQIG
jgi:hypothetical protein